MVKRIDVLFVSVWAVKARNSADVPAAWIRLAEHPGRERASNRLMEPGSCASTPAGLQTAIEEGFMEDGPIPIEFPIKTGGEASPRLATHPATGR